jgi:hypothetical protein
MWFLFLFRRIPLRAYLYAAALAGVLSGFVYIKHLGYTECRKEALEQQLKEIRKYDKIKAEVSKLSDSDLDKRLAPWMLP